MPTTELGDTFLEREYEATNTDGNKSIIKLRLGIPYHVPDSTSSLKWRCAYQIVGTGFEKVKLAQGMDAIDSMLVCVQLADVWMKMYQKDMKITWLGEEWLGLVFPAVSELTDEIDEHSPFFEQIFDEFFRNFKGNRSFSQAIDHDE